MPLDIPLSAASCPTVHPSCRRNSLTRAAMTVPSASSRSPARPPNSVTGRDEDSPSSSAARAVTLLLLGCPGIPGGSPARSLAGPAVDGHGISDDNIHLVKHCLIYGN